MHKKQLLNYDSKPAIRIRTLVCIFLMDAVKILVLLKRNPV